MKQTGYICKRKVFRSYRGQKTLSRLYRSSLFFLTIPILLALTLSTKCGSEFKILLDDDNISPALYWSETGGTIRKVSLDGTGEKIIITVSGTPLDIALYIPGRKIYWAEYSGSAYYIKRAGLDGGGAEVLYSSLSDFGPSAIAIDGSEAIIYWNEYNIASTHNDIWRSVLDSFSTEKWKNTIAQPYTFSISLDTINRNIYFSANSYWSVNLVLGSGNSGVACYGELDVLSGYSTPVNEIVLAPDSVRLRGIAVDGAKGYVYYAVNNATGYHIIRSDLSLLNPVEWVSSPGFPDFGIRKLALDLKDRKIYWTSATDNSIYRADLDTPGSNIEKFLQLSSTATGIAVVH